MVSALRSVEFGVPDLPAAEDFFVNTWHLTVAARQGGAVYLRGTGANHHLLALRPSAVPVLNSVTFRATTAQALSQIADNALLHGGKVVSARALVAEPGGGEAVTVRDPQGRILRFVHGDMLHTDTDPRKTSLFAWRTP